MNKVNTIRASKILVGGAGIFIVVFFTICSWLAKDIEISLWSAYITGLLLGVFLSIGVIVISEGLRGK